MTIRAMICGSSGLTLTPEETAFFRRTQPAGFILFVRNCEIPAQVSDLVKQFQDCVDHQALVLIDQEGGRVQRLTPPHWAQYPPGEVFGRIYDQNTEAGLEAAHLSARLIGDDLHRLGINMNCLPVLDLAFEGRHQVIGSRAYHSDPAIVSALGRAASEGLLAAGVLPVIKHIPGHGRAGVDSHEKLPEVDATREDLASLDFIPFTALNDMPAAMTAHILYTDLDPVRPATTSRGIIKEVIRGAIGFDGLLMSDDVSMGALSGTIAERTVALFEAGCDVALHCNGELEEMEEMAAQTPELAATSKTRFERTIGMIKTPGDFDRDLSWHRLQTLIND